MSVILPGNWVTNANVYPRKKKLADGSEVIERHGVECIPGFAFYKLIGYYATNDDSLAAGTYDLTIGSPDLRQDDKPRLDAPFVVPAGAIVYRNAVSVVNGVGDAAGGTVTVDGVSGTAAASTGATDLSYPDGVASETGALFGITAEVSDATIKITTAGQAINREDKRNWLIILVEVDYLVDSGAPVLDDINAPFLIEAGQDKAY